mmetsp:Transcript_3800/g.8161  ORF Transcript_3800/g.8161 Transcript_3800/m.8161 type:complete len:216 (-) Transcript_3800:449-1096(-)
MPEYHAACTISSNQRTQHATCRRTSSAAQPACAQPACAQLATPACAWTGLCVHRSPLSTSWRLDRLGAGDDLGELGGDLRLPQTVVRELQLADHVLGVARGRVHGGHARRLLAGHVLEEAAVDGGGEVKLVEVGQRVLLVLALELILVHDAALAEAFRPLHRLRDDVELDDRLELVVNDAVRFGWGGKHLLSQEGCHREGDWALVRLVVAYINVP